jgi:hypothetical protein
MDSMATKTPKPPGIPILHFREQSAEICDLSSGLVENVESKG